MTHDFAKNSGGKKKPQAKNKAKAKANSQVPGWVWLLTGIVAGVFISFLAFLADVTPEPAPKPLSDQIAKAKEQAKETITTKFDFYTLLPEREVIVPVDDSDPAESEDGDQPSTIYMLQAGSFKNAKDADRLRARLILMGLDVRIEDVAIDNGEIWHRVQVGPFENRSTLSSARGQLISEGIETLLIKRKG